jgi:hypothetical protein
MAIWEVMVEDKRFVRVKVEASSWSDAQTQALGAYKADPGRHPALISIAADRTDLYASPIRQHGEPWVSGPDPFYFKKGKPEGVLVFERAYGNKFTQDDLDILLKRCSDLGLKVVKHWNGLGVASFSIECEDLSPVNDTIIAALSAPRETAPRCKACGQLLYKSKASAAEFCANGDCPGEKA